MIQEHVRQFVGDIALLPSLRVERVEDNHDAVGGRAKGACGEAARLNAIEFL